MPKKSDIPLQTVTLNLVKGDREILQEFYPHHSYQVVTRLLVRRHCKRLLERANEQGVDNRGSTEQLTRDDLDGA